MTRVVVKVGTSSLIHDRRGTLRLSSLAKICETLVDLNHEGLQIVLVSSGAVGAGCQRLGIDRKDVTRLSQKQALAATDVPNMSMSLVPRTVGEIRTARIVAARYASLAYCDLPT